VSVIQLRKLVTDECEVHTSGTVSKFQRELLGLKPTHPSYLSAYEDGTVCSETLAYKIQTPRNYQEESVQQNNKNVQK